MIQSGAQAAQRLLARPAPASLVASRARGAFARTTVCSAAAQAAQRASAAAARPAAPAQVPFQFAVLQSLLQQEPSQQLPRALQPLAARLQELGGSSGGAPLDGAAAARAAAERGLPLALLVGTGGTEALALEVTRAYHEAYSATRPAGEADRCAAGQVQGHRGRTLGAQRGSASSAASSHARGRLSAGYAQHQLPETC